MTNRDLLHTLRNAVTTEEWDLLNRQAAIILPEAGLSPAACMPNETEKMKSLKEDWMLPINAFNLQQFMEMETLVIPDEALEVLDEARVEGCRRSLIGFLEKVFQENREAWHWIVDSCIYLAFIAKKPMHPIDVVGITVTERDGKTIFQCPCYTDTADSNCNFCVCEKK